MKIPELIAELERLYSDNGAQGKAWARMENLRYTDAAKEIGERIAANGTAINALIAKNLTNPKIEWGSGYEVVC
jgi:hypothetical protein